MDEPKPDMIGCARCHGLFYITDCEIDYHSDYYEGSWEEVLCPVCVDGGECNDPHMSNERAKEWNEWFKNISLKELTPT